MFFAGGPSAIWRQIQNIAAKSDLRTGSDTPAEEQPDSESVSNKVASMLNTSGSAGTNGDTVVIINPLTQKLLDLKPEDLKPKIPADLPIRIKKFSRRLIFPIYIFSAAIPLLMAVARKTGHSGAVSLLAKRGFGVGRFMLMAIAVTSLIVWFTLKFNLLYFAGFAFLLSLVVLVTSSAISLKLYDWNIPVWNEMFMAVIWPTASGLIIRLLVIKG